MIPLGTPSREPQLSILDCFQPSLSLTGTNILNPCKEQARSTVLPFPLSERDLQFKMIFVAVVVVLLLSHV